MPTETNPKMALREVMDVRLNMRALFTANPTRYAPRYGGYCSLGLAAGEYAIGDPEAWSIVDGKLYLTKATKFVEPWREGQKAFIRHSEYNWKKNRDQLRDNR